MRVGHRAAAIALLGLGACAAQDPAPPAAPPIVIDAPLPATTAIAAPAASDHQAAARTKVREMLARVARARGLPITREVPSRVLNRDEVLTRIRAKVASEIPPDVVEHEGELLAALELVPPEYDFVEGTYRLIQGRIAGFYEPLDHTMYLVDDLGDDEADETLAHELCHALQDQSFDLKKLLTFTPGEGDRLSAGHAVAEGDAMSGMFDVTVGSAFNVPEAALRKALALSNAVAETSDKTPHVLQESLTVPYADGFSFVQRRREAGGWAAVDSAWREMPVSTEQLLHPEKYASREAPVAVPVPSLAALGPGFRAATHDVVGEQGLRLMFGEWLSEVKASEAAAGWGGDRYVIARRDDAADRHTIAVGWRLVMDSDGDAGEVAAALKKRFGAPCRERAALGPLAWQRRGRTIAVAAGPFERRGRQAKSAGNCATTARWLSQIMGP